MRLLMLCLLCVVCQAADVSPQTINFSLQIRPLLSEKCFHCHGPDEKHRKAKLRLDLEQDAKAVRDGKAAIVPGNPAASVVWQRLTTTDADDVMPPPDAHRPVSEQERQLIRQWIEQGADWGQHWAFEPLKKNAVKTSASATLDELVEQNLRANNLQHSQPASPHVLVRRLSFDLIGLPPTPARADKFASDFQNNPEQTLSNYVDELLSSPAYGEHWARMWLDLARYADTKGYEKDRGRKMWPYRDWVVEAFNSDMPYDQFTIEQLAGDLLDKPSEAQRIATAFHRNTMSNDEGGTDDEEFRILAVKDRADTTGQIWLGLTVGCAKCHSHKYDPISMRDYYSFFAIFNQTADADAENEAPIMEITTADHDAELKKLEQDIADARKTVDKATKASKDNTTSQGGNQGKSSSLADLKKKLRQATNAMNSYRSALPSVLVMQELPADKRRTTHLHERGNFLDHGEQVDPAVLPIPGLPNLKVDQPNRLRLAQWLMDPGNPLTPRVTANRIWARLFGIGIVETEEDFGSLGSLPSNAALLDFLAAQYRDACGWSLKRFLKVIVMSKTYRQAVNFMPDRLERDPANRWLAGAPRLRLSAEQIRDQALFVAGLLSPTMGGPSVMPPQPAGLWRSTYNTMSWVDATGDNRYRRALYTYLKRTTPYPSFIAFDAGSGEVCQIRRIATNTPLQALVTLNDPVYLEAAAHLAQRVCSEKPERRAEILLRTVLIRPVSDEEIAQVQSAQAEALKQFSADPSAARTFLQSCNLKPAESDDVIDIATWTIAAHVVLNLDECLSRN